MRTQPVWLAFDQSQGPRGFALGRWLALLILVSTAFVYAERASAAGCANLLVGSHGEHGFAMDAASEDDTGSAIRFLSPDLSHPMPTPCTGPNCGRAPKVPPPASLSILPSIKIFACPSGCAAAIEGLEAGPMLADSLEAELAGYPLRIDRPPVL